MLRKTAACNEGQLVAKGTVLFEIDPRDYQLDVQRLEGKFRQAALNIEEIDEELAQNATSAELSQRQVDLARREVARLDNLKANRIITETEHERALRDELTATNALTMLQGQKRVLTKRRGRLHRGAGAGVDHARAGQARPLADAGRGAGRWRGGGRQSGAGLVRRQGNAAGHARGHECRGGEDEPANGRTVAGLGRPRG